MKKIVTMGASSYTGNYLLPRVLAEWEKLSPDSELKLEISDSEDVFTQVDTGVLELGLIGACLESQNVSAREFLKNDPLILIVPPSHPWAGEKAVAVDDLRGQNFILREPGSATRMWYRESFNRHGLTFDELNVVAEFDSHPAVISAVEAGCGVSMVPEKAATDSLDLGRCRRVDVKELSPMWGSLYMIWPTANSLSAETREFMNFLESERPKLGFAA